MSNDTNMKEVAFNLYCPKCKHWYEVEDLERCNECVGEAGRENTRKPINYDGPDLVAKEAK